METPIACTLTPDQLTARTAALAALGGDALLRRRPTARGERLTFRAGDDVAERLPAAIAAERSCCAFLTFELHREPDCFVLDITGAEEARPFIAELFA
jgi:hypothetical protein